MTSASPYLRFDEKVVIITGAGAGLGRAHALLLASRGAHVLVNDAGVSPDGVGASRTPAEDVSGEIERMGGSAVANHVPVGTSTSARQIVEAALDAFGRIDILINNAGIIRDAAFHKMSESDITDVANVHLFGSLFLAKEVWPRFREQHGGKVLNTTSNVALLGNFGQANYAAAKSGLIGLTKSLAVEGKRSNIQVNALAPAAVTRMTPEGLIDFELPPEDVAPAAAWLVHDECSTTGEVLSAGGGRVARYFIGLTQGSWQPQPTPESVRDNFTAVLDETNYLVPDGPGAEMELIRSLSRGEPQPQPPGQVTAHPQES